MTSSLLRIGRSALNVIPRDSVVEGHQINNIRVNLKQISKWISRARVHDKKALVVSAGPSLDHLLGLKYVTDKPGFDIFSVKHALPVLRKHGIVPKFCVVLDPRSVDGTSTHGVIRRDLFEGQSKETTFLVSSSTSHDTVKYLLDKGYNVVGWHAAIHGIQTFEKEIDMNLVINGGTCAATRSIVLASVLGYTKAYLLGFDSSLGKTPTKEMLAERVLFDDDVNWNNFVDYKTKSVAWDQAEQFIKEMSKKNNSPRYFAITLGQDSKIFYTSGELAAQLQDLERFLNDPHFPLEIIPIGLDKEMSAFGAMVDKLPNRTIRRTLEEIVA